MTHLTDLELLAIAERTAPPDPRDAAHLASCAACAEAVAELRGARDLATAVEIPEPSPLFWDHFSARVQSSVRDVEPGYDARWRTWLLGSPYAAAAAAVVVVLVAIGGVIWRSADTVVEQPTVIAGTSTAPLAAPDPGTRADVEVESDGAWELVRDVADDVSWDDAVAAGWMVPTGSADDAALTLTPEERGALVEILRAETGHAGA